MEDMGNLNEPVTRAEFLPVKNDMERIKETMYGNGKKGLDEVMRNVQDYIEEEKKGKAALKAKREAEVTRLKWTILGVGLPIVIGFIYQFFYFWTVYAPQVQTLIDQIQKSPV